MKKPLNKIEIIFEMASDLFFFFDELNCPLILYSHIYTHILHAIEKNQLNPIDIDNENKNMIALNWIPKVRRN